jgi:hypothetical protein
MDGTRTIDPAGISRLGLVIPGPRGLDTADGLARWLVETARPSLDVVDLDDPTDRDRDGYVLLTGQYGPAPAPAVEDVVTRYAARWADRPIGLVSYGGVSRGRDAATRIRRSLEELGAVVIDAVLGANVAQVRGEGGPGGFERVAWELVLEGVVDVADVARARNTAPR